MIVNAAIFTCSICGEASVNICSYCTKDACPNHRCERCKRCSDCCECEVPLSAEEPIVMEAEAAAQPLPEPEAIVTELEAIVPEPEALELTPPVPPVPVAEPRFPVFLTAAESSVFVPGSVYSEPLE